MRSTGDPNYEYRPQSDEHRAKLRKINCERLGIPLDACLIRGHLYPIRYREILVKIAARLSRTHEDDAFVQALQDVFVTVAGPHEAKKWNIRLMKFYAGEDRA